MAVSASFREIVNHLDVVYTVQKRFSVDATHEFRIPLAVLQAKIEVFQKTDCHTKEEYNALISAMEK